MAGVGPLLSPAGWLRAVRLAIARGPRHEGPAVTVRRRPGESAADFMARVDAVAAAGPPLVGRVADVIVQPCTACLARVVWLRGEEWHRCGTCDTLIWWPAGAC